MHSLKKGLTDLLRLALATYVHEMPAGFNQDFPKIKKHNS